MNRNTPSEIRRDLPANLKKGEGESLVALGMRLQAQRSLPSPTFRGDLHRRLAGYSISRLPISITNPTTIRVMILSYIALGTILLAIAAIGLAGDGPFAA